MSDELRSIVLGTAGLSVAALIALWLTLARGGIESTETQLRAAMRVVVLAVGVQAAHFGEEWATGFHRRFPELLGLMPWSPGFFVSFNVFWLAVWVLAILGLAARSKAALFPLWFLALACVGNGIAHPALSLRTNGYFPGVVTSPLLAAVGLLLLRSLSTITADRAEP